MSIPIRSFFPCLFVLSMLGCASQSQLTPDVAARIKRVAPISMVGDEYERQYIGFTVFGNEDDKKDISNWDIDAAYEAQLAAAAQAMGLSAAQSSYPHEAFAHVNDLKGPWSIPAYWGPNWENIEEPARAYCSANSLDALLVVAKSHRSEPLNGSNQWMYGVGSFLRGHGSPILHMFAVVGLIDCSTGKLLAQQWLGLKRADWPVAPLPADVAKTPVAKWSPELEKEIREAVIQLPTATWPHTLKLLFSPVS